MENSIPTANQPTSAPLSGPLSEPVAPASPALPPGLPPGLAFWIRTPCGRAKYQALAARSGPLARLRLLWFVAIAALRDLSQPLPPEEGPAPPDEKPGPST